MSARSDFKPYLNLDNDDNVINDLIKHSMGENLLEDVPRFLIDLFLIDLLEKLIALYRVIKVIVFLFLARIGFI